MACAWTQGVDVVLPRVVLTLVIITVTIHQCVRVPTRRGRMIVTCTIICRLGGNTLTDLILRRVFGVVMNILVKTPTLLIRQGMD